MIQKPQGPRTPFMSNQSDIQRVQSGTYQSDIQQMNQYNEQGDFGQYTDSPQEIMEAQQQARSNGGFQLPPMNQTPPQVLGFEEGKFDYNCNRTMERHHYHNEKTKMFLKHRHENTDFSQSPYSPESQGHLNKMLPFKNSNHNPVGNMLGKSKKKHELFDMNKGSKSVNDFLLPKKSNFSLMGSISKKSVSKKLPKGFGW